MLYYNDIMMRIYPIRFWEEYMTSRVAELKPDVLKTEDTAKSVVQASVVTTTKNVVLERIGI